MSVQHRQKLQWHKRKGQMRAQGEWRMFVGGRGTAPERGRRRLGRMSEAAVGKVTEATWGWKGKVSGAEMKGWDVGKLGLPHLAWGAEGAAARPVKQHRRCSLHCSQQQCQYNMQACMKRHASAHALEQDSCVVYLVVTLPFLGTLSVSHTLS